MTWCSQMRDAFRKPLEEYGADDLRREFYRYKGCNTRCTIGCARSASTLDGLFAQPDGR